MTSGSESFTGMSQGIERIMKRCSSGQAEQLIPHFISSYRKDTIQLRESAYAFVCDLQKTLRKHELFGITREIPAFSLVIDRHMGVSECRYLMQRSQDIANRVGLNHYKGYILIYFGDQFEQADINENNELLRFLNSDVFMKHPDIRSYIVVPDVVKDRMQGFMNRELPSPMISCQETSEQHTDENDEKEALFNLFKLNARKYGVSMPSSSKDYKMRLLELVPPVLRNREAVTRMVCRIALSEKSLSINNLSVFVEEESHQITKNQKTEIGFRR